MRSLVAVKDQALPLFRERLLVRSVPAERVNRLIADLDDPSFRARERASRELAALGKAAEAALRKVQDRPPSAEVGRRVKELLARLESQGRSEELTSLRAVEVLEHVGSPEARQLLTGLTKGSAGARLMEEARASLQRLERREGKP